MKLSTVFVAQGALAHLAALRMPSKVAYRVLKFSRKFDVEFGIVNEQREKLIREISGAKEGESAKIEPDTPGMEIFSEKLGALLDTDCELAPCPLKFSALVDAIDSEDGNALSAQDLALLEPLFEPDEEAAEEKKPDLSIAK